MAQVILILSHFNIDYYFKILLIDHFTTLTRMNFTSDLNNDCMIDFN